MSEHICQKEKQFEELYNRTNSQDRRLVATEVRMQLVLWVLALIVTLISTNIVITIFANQQKTTEMYQHYQQQTK